MYVRFPSVFRVWLTISVLGNGCSGTLLALMWSGPGSIRSHRSVCSFVGLFDLGIWEAGMKLALSGLVPSVVLADAD